jgi:hypothetical protein
MYCLSLSFFLSFSIRNQSGHHPSKLCCCTILFTSTTIMDLPNELWITVLSYLEIPDKIAFAKVKKKFQIYKINFRVAIKP